VDGDDVAKAIELSKIEDSKRIEDENRREREMMERVFKESEESSRREEEKRWRSLPHYKLHAVVHHKGEEAFAGHYVVDIVNFSGAWRRYDDALVSDTDDPTKSDSKRDPKGEGTRQEKEAYILFYVLTY